MEKTLRIEYIDAMRGFTMFLVVLGHCAFFCMGDVGRENIYLDVFQSFRMPLFFFVSGLVFYKENRIWRGEEIKVFFTKKLQVQIISPLLFFLIFVYLNKIDLLSALFDPLKSGYWFTFTLFEYFCLFVVIELFVSFIKCSDLTRTLILLVTSIILSLITHNRIISILPCNDCLQLLGFSQMSFFIYFVLGTLVRKQFYNFQLLLDKTVMITICVVVFLSLIIFEEYTRYVGVKYIVSILKAISGIVIVFAIFRKYAHIFSTNTAIGRILQFTGRRTLDIYLLHYFFLPKGLSLMFSSWNGCDDPLFVVLTAMILAIIVVCISLLTSSVIRLSPDLASFLFGHKNTLR